MNHAAVLFSFPPAGILIGSCGPQLQPLLTREESGPNLFFHDEEAQPISGEGGFTPKLPIALQSFICANRSSPGFSDGPFTYPPESKERFSG